MFSVLCALVSRKLTVAPTYSAIVVRTAGCRTEVARSLCSKVGEDVVKRWGTNPRTGVARMGNNWNYQAEMSALAVRLGHLEAELPSLQKALESEKVDGTRSLPTKDSPSQPNRHSVLGKAILHCYLNEYLFYTYPMMNGSMLQDLGISLTSYDSLKEISDYIGVTDLIRTRKNLSLPSNIQILSYGLCAVIGCVYQDKGPKAARKVVIDLVVSQLAGKDLEVVIKMEHPRLMLKSILQEQQRPLPRSALINESGRATHFPSFRVGVFSGSDLLGEGTGSSLRRAEKEAMLTALRTHFMKEISQAPLPSDNEDYFSESELQDKMCKGMRSSYVKM